MRRLGAILITTGLILILLLGVRDLPEFGRGDNPANNEVVAHYIEKGTEETGAMNIVTGIILDYRAFDTFVEASVLFTATVVVLLVLKKDKDEKKEEAESSFKNNTILSEVSKIINPFIQIFGLYVIFFGHLGPGGGFAGGTIIGASFIIYYLSKGKDEASKKLQYKKLMMIQCGAIMLYGLLKGYSFITGGSHIHLPQPGLGIPGNILSGGFLLPLNILVGCIVAITMYFFFTLFDKGEI